MGGVRGPWWGRRLSSGRSARGGGTTLEAEGVTWEEVERVFEAALEEDMGRRGGTWRIMGEGWGRLPDEENFEGNPAG
jgi:hypothetical protein